MVLPKARRPYLIFRDDDDADDDDFDDDFDDNDDSWRILADPRRTGKAVQAPSAAISRFRRLPVIET